MPIPISIIVPTYRGGRYLRHCLESLVDQNYPALEILIADGGSNDGSIAIIEEFANKVHWWVSEPDRGQSHAINKSLAKASGDIVNWLCSDDLLEPGTLAKIDAHFQKNPETDALAGHCKMVNAEDGRLIDTHIASEEFFGVFPPGPTPLPQPSCFFRRSLLRRNPPIREDLDFVMDYELWCYLKKNGARFTFTNEVFATALQWDNNKSSQSPRRFIEELYTLFIRGEGGHPRLAQFHQKTRLPLLSHRLRTNKNSWSFTAAGYFLRLTELAMGRHAEALRQFDWLEIFLQREQQS